MLGTTIKEFKLVERLGKGGWGEVWAAEQQIVKTRVAIKILRSEVSGDAAHVQRFFNEAIAVGRIPHAGIVKIFDVGFDRGQAFLIMELLAGEVLSARIRRETRLPFEQVIDISRQITGVLAATHAAGIVHRDLKPDNVFLVPDAELGERVKVLDFGIAKLSAIGSTGPTSLGTPAYMAPEQWTDAASIDERADIYSLGCVMFELCGGRPPFLATTPGEACGKHMHEPPIRTRALAPALPSELDDLIDRMLSKQPDGRPTLAEIETLLAAAIGDEPRTSKPVVRASGPLAGTATRSNHPDGTAETLSSTSSQNNAATVTSLAGAVVMQSQPPAPKRHTLVVAGGVIAAGALAAAVFVATRGDDAADHGRVTIASPLEPPALGLAAIAAYRFPTPATVGNQRSEQVWSGARDNFAAACKQPGALATWCAGEQFALGELALIRDDVPGAVERFREAVALDSKWSTGYLGLANALAFQRKLDESLEAARHAQQLEPTAWQPALASARAYISVKQVDDALIEYRRAMNGSPPDNAVLISEVALAFHYAYKDDEARKLAAQASALDPSLVAVNVLEAELFLEAGNGAKALAYADRALAVSPKNGAALIARGDALTLLGRDGDARETYRRAIALRGGMNILAISEPRLAAISAALDAGVAPPPRVVERSSTPLNQESPPFATRSRPATPARSAPPLKPERRAPAPPDAVRDTDTGARAGPHNNGDNNGDTSTVGARSPSTAWGNGRAEGGSVRSPPTGRSNRPDDDRSPPSGTDSTRSPPKADDTDPDAKRATKPTDRSPPRTQEIPKTKPPRAPPRAKPPLKPVDRSPPRPDKPERSPPADNFGD